jgi:hypothetical protein
VVAAAPLSGPAGVALAAPVEVRVFGSDDLPLRGRAVTFSASNGGQVDPVTAISDENGIASTHWTLGQIAGPNVLTADAGSGVTVTLDAIATAGPPAVLSVFAGNDQIAEVGSAVPVAPSVGSWIHLGICLRRSGGFSIATGAGTLTNSVRSTDAQGIATVGSWVLGTFGAQTLNARVEGGSVDPVLFRLPARCRRCCSGDNGRQPAECLRGQTVAVSPAVAIRTSNGKGVAGVPVTFEVLAGGGSVVGSSQVTMPAALRPSVSGFLVGRPAQTRFGRRRLGSPRSSSAQLALCPDFR